MWPSCFKFYFITVTQNLHFPHFVTSDNNTRKPNFSATPYLITQQHSTAARNPLVRTVETNVFSADVARVESSHAG